VVRTRVGRETADGRSACFQAGAPLPPLLLLVLYNGERRWKAATTMSLSQMKTMLSTQYDVWKEQWLAEGEAKGKAEGKAEALICLLAERFGAVAPSWQERIRGAELATLEHWFKRAIVAPDLPSVFNASERMAF
jgi:hypothetical protein